MIRLSVLLEEGNGAELPPCGYVCWTSSSPFPPRCISHLFSVTNHSWDFVLSSLSAHLPPRRLQLRKDVSSLSAAQTGDSPTASTPVDTPCLPESAMEEGQGGCPEGKVDEEAPKGASLAQESAVKQDGVCGWVMLVWWANEQRNTAVLIHYIKKNCISV